MAWQDHEWLLARDQYGDEVVLGDNVKHPRKALLEKVGGTSAQKMYVDDTTGKSHHVGYIVGNRWYTLYRVRQWESARSRPE